MSKPKRNKDVWSIVSKSGKNKIGVGFYDNKGKNINPEKINIKFKNSETGRFVSKAFCLGRDAKNGQFIPVKEAERRPNTTTVERIPKSGNGDNIQKNSPVYFKIRNKKR